MSCLLTPTDNDNDNDASTMTVNANTACSCPSHVRVTSRICQNRSIENTHLLQPDTLVADASKIPHARLLSEKFER